MKNKFRLLKKLFFVAKRKSWRRRHRQALYRCTTVNELGKYCTCSSFSRFDL